MKKRSAKTTTAAGTRAQVRPQVRQLLERSESYRSLPPQKRREIARDTVQVASYLVDPHRLVSQEFAHPVLAPNDLLSATTFPAFVSGLIDGVFGAIVNASIQQLEAYADLVERAAASVSEFMADNITSDRAWIELTNTFPQVLCTSGKGGRHSAGEARPDRSAIAHMARTLGLRRPWPAVDSAEGRRVLITAMRRRIARERQKSFALALSMGINRIVVLKGHIPARPSPTR
jgi:hypothetical protein